MMLWYPDSGASFHVIEGKGAGCGHQTDSGGSVNRYLDESIKTKTLLGAKKQSCGNPPSRLRGRVSVTSVMWLVKGYKYIIITVLSFVVIRVGYVLLVVMLRMWVSGMSKIGLLIKFWLHK